MKAAGCVRKGSDGERELVQILDDAGVPARRMPMSGALPFPERCDVLLLPEGSSRWQRIEVKRRARFALCRWFDNAELVAFREDRGAWYIALPIARYIQLVRGLQ